MGSERDNPQDLSSEERTPSDSEVAEHPFELPDDVAPVSRSTPDAETPAAGPVSFDTVPGGGTNRLSGGRAAARAYVRAKTPLPLHAGPADTVSVDVDARVSVEGRAFQTSPSLQRRRISETELGSLPPVAYPMPFSWKRASLILAAVAVGSFVLAVLWAGSARETAVEVEALGSPPSPTAKAPVDKGVASAVPSAAATGPSVAPSAPAQAPGPSATSPTEEKKTEPPPDVRNTASERPSKPATAPHKPTPTETEPWLE